MRKNNQQHGKGVGGIIKGSYSPFIEFVCKPHLTTQLPRWGRETGKPKKSVYVAGYLVNPTKWELRSEDGGRQDRERRVFCMLR